MKPLLLAATLATLPATSALAQAACPTDVRYPAAEWPTRAAEVAAQKAAAIQDLEAYAFTRTGTEADRKGIRTDGVIVIHHGELIYEKYAPGFSATKRHLTWSVSKSVTSALVGIAASRGALALGDSICTHLKTLPESACQVTVKDLLEFASGFDWAETYEGKSNQASSVLAMLYGQGHRDMASFVAAHPLRDAPGTTFMYSSGETTLLASVLGEAVKAKLGLDATFPWTLLFDGLGIQSAVWERDGQGHLIGSSYLYLTPRDMARFGYLYLHDGCWAGQPVLPAGWVADSTAVSEPFKRNPLEENKDVQGRQWWLNRLVPEAGITQLPWPDVPDDAYGATGHWGQSITVIPSLDLVVVRTGDDRDGSFDRNQFLKLARELVR